MYRHTGRLPACSAVVEIVDAAEALDNRAPSRLICTARICPGAPCRDAQIKAFCGIHPSAISTGSRARGDQRRQ